MLNHQLIALVDYLKKHGEVGIKEYALGYEMSVKQVYADVSQVNDLLKVHTDHQYLIEISDGVMRVNESLKNDWLVLKERLPQTSIFLQEERKYAIIIFTFIKQGWLSNQHYQDLLKISKNSVLLELKKVRALAHHYQVELQYNRQSGYLLAGTEMHRRELVVVALEQLLTMSTGKWLLKKIFHHWQLSFSLVPVTEKMLHLTQKYQVVFVQERFELFAVLLQLLMVEKQQEPLDFTEEKANFIKAQPLFEVGKEIVRDFSLAFDLVGNQLFITVHLLAAIQGKNILIADNSLMVLTEKIVQRVQMYTLNQFDETDKLVKNLYEHLVPCYFRLLFNIPLTNPFEQQIKEKYHELFFLVEKSLKPLEEKTGKRLSDSEIAYFTIHFGGQLRVEARKVKPIRALTVCPNGISSSLVLNSELKSLFPDFDFQRVHGLKEAKQLPVDSYDVVFSTVYFDFDRKGYLVKPIMNMVEKELLKKQVHQDFKIDEEQTVDVFELIKTIKKYAVISNESGLYKSLVEKLYDIKMESRGMGLIDLLKKEHIQQTSKKLSWQAAITLAAQPLLDQKIIEASYIEAMIKSVEQIGPYIVLAPKVAVPHARPEDGVNDLGISLLQLAEPVDFNLAGEHDDERWVQLIFVIAAIDNTSHLTALQQLSVLLEEETNIEELTKQATTTDLYQLIDEKTKN